MRGPRERRRLAVGDRVRVGGVGHILIGVSGTRVRLADENGNVVSVTVAQLLTEDRFELIDAGVGEVARPQRGGWPARRCG